MTLKIDLKATETSFQKEEEIIKKTPALPPKVKNSQENLDQYFDSQGNQIDKRQFNENLKRQDLATLPPPPKGAKNDYRLRSEAEASNIFTNMSLDEMRTRVNLSKDQKFSALYHSTFNKKAKLQAKEKTKLLLEKRKAKRALLEDTNYDKPLGSEADSQNLDDFSEFDSTGNRGIDSNVDSSVKHTLSNNDFFKRPFIVNTVTINIGSDVNLALAVWDLWSRDPFIRTRLRGYAYLKGNLHVRIVTSSTKYHYGTLMASYQPFANANPTLAALDEFAGEGELMRRCKLNYLSQSPEVMYISYGKDNAVEMTLPLMIPKQALRLYNDDGLLIDNDNAFDEMLAIGKLYLTSLNKLRVASDDIANPITLQVYAWMEDVELGPITAVDMDIASEAEAKPILSKALNVGKMFVQDEYSDGGPLSQTASAISNIAEKLSDVPVIGKLAKATSRVAGFGAKVLKLFGFSKPVQLEPVVHVKQLAYSNGCVLEGLDTSLKLTCDPKQELTVQPLGSTFVDEMAIKHMTSRESYFHTFDWALTSLPMTTTLFSVPVYPMVTTRAISAFGQSVHQLTSLANAGLPFGFWRGTISFRFQIACSAFHKGKLMFIYEPASTNINLIEANTTQLNKQYITYIDIEDCKDITIDCGFVHDKLFANITPVVDNQIDAIIPNINYSSADVTVHEQLALNRQSIGTLYCRPFTRLTSPSLTDSTIKINCFVKSDDMEFAVPETLNFSELDTTREIESEAEAVHRVLINQHQPKNDNIYLFHFGEKVESFRALLKRDQAVGVALVSSNTDGFTKYQIPMYPCPISTGVPKYFIGGGPATSLPGGTSMTFNGRALSSLFDHLRYSFLFMKGGYRYKFVELDSTNFKGVINVDRKFVSGSGQYNYVIPLDPNFFPDLRGSLTFSQNAGSGVEFEIPYYSDNQFEMSCLPYVQDTETLGNMFTHYYNGALVSVEHSTTSTNTQMCLSAHSAEDFTMFRYQGGTFYVY